MSKESDIDTIMRLLPLSLHAKSEAVRSRLEKLPDEDLAGIRASLISISEQEPSPAWYESYKKDSDLSSLQSLLKEWEQSNEHIKAQGWLET